MRKYRVCLLAAALIAAPALAVASHAVAQDSGYSQNDDDRDAPPGNPPPAGADVGYDYLNHQYYRYEGPAPQAPAAREQRGYRDGHIEREPLTPYWSGVRQVYPYYGYYHRCGCYARYGYGYRDGYRRHRSAYYEDDRYLGDDLDTQDYGSFSYNYSTRRYTDHHLGHDGDWGW